MATLTHRIRTADRTRQRKLERLRAEQSATLQARRHFLRDGPPTATSGVTDSEELSLDAEGQGVGCSVLELTSQTLQGIETALQRLEVGAFGSCSDCGRRISDARLRALPFAAQCLACQDSRDVVGIPLTSQETPGWTERVAWTRSRSLGH
jgi:RNA polymerase-binding transcription factor DksA